MIEKPSFNTKNNDVNSFYNELQNRFTEPEISSILVEMVFLHRRTMELKIENLRDEISRTEDSHQILNQIK